MTRVGFSVLLVPNPEPRGKVVGAGVCVAVGAGAAVGVGVGVGDGVGVTTEPTGADSGWVAAMICAGRLCSLATRTFADASLGGALAKLLTRTSAAPTDAYS
jgi:hypothetical protein